MRTDSQNSRYQNTGPEKAIIPGFSEIRLWEKHDSEAKLLPLYIMFSNSYTD